MVTSRPRSAGGLRSIVLLWLGWTLGLALLVWWLMPKEFAMVLPTVGGRPVSLGQLAAALLALAYMPPVVITVAWMIGRRRRR